MGKYLLIKRIKYLKYIFIIIIYFYNFTHILFANPEKGKIISLLEGRHWILNTDKFLKLGDGVEEVLIDIAGDTKKINYLRFRALEALALFPTEKTANFLESTAEKTFPGLAKRGFEAFRSGFYKIKPKRLKRLATRLLKNSNPNIRISAARTIRSMDTSRFKKFLKSESNIWVLKEAQK